MLGEAVDKEPSKMGAHDDGIEEGLGDAVAAPARTPLSTRARIFSKSGLAGRMTVLVTGSEPDRVPFLDPYDELDPRLELSLRMLTRTLSRTAWAICGYRMNINTGSACSRMAPATQRWRRIRLKSFAAGAGAGVPECTPAVELLEPRLDPLDLAIDFVHLMPPSGRDEHSTHTRWVTVASTPPGLRRRRGDGSPGGRDRQRSARCRPR